MSLICHLTITNSCWDTHAARTNSWGTLHTARINSGGHVNSYLCKYNASVGVRRGTKPLSMSTRCQVRCPAVKKPDSLQAPERLHVETWAGRDCSPSLLISQAVEIGLGCADMFVRLHPSFLRFRVTGPGREVGNGMGWTLLEKTTRSGVRWEGAVHSLHLLQLEIGSGKDRFLQRGRPSLRFLRVLAHTRMSEARLSGHSLGGGAGHC